MHLDKDVLRALWKVWVIEEKADPSSNIHDDYYYQGASSFLDFISSRLEEPVAHT